MKQSSLNGVLILLFIGLLFLYYRNPIEVGEIDSIFLTLSTFLFALFTGFFISRQAARYSKIRELTATFDGNMSALYRLFGHLGKTNQKAVGEIILAHYETVLKKGWDYPFTHKTSTLTSMHDIAEKASKQRGGTDGIRGQSLGRLIGVLIDTQKIRKNMLALDLERIPHFQWLLIYLLAAILIFTVSTIPSEGLFLGSAIKAAFITSVIVVLVLLRRFDRLQIFSNIIGERSAKDVIAIIKGTK